MVHGADKVVHVRRRREFTDQAIVSWPYPLALKADQDVDLVCILGLQRLRLGQVGLMTGARTAREASGSSS